ncbi:MAG: hypothetical protein JOZ95_10285 [Solirubrobacterales bacterium]|nr:hypothetical protein [Solirubrobacterales bacterium]
MGVVSVVGVVVVVVVLVGVVVLVEVLVDVEVVVLVEGEVVGVEAVVEVWCRQSLVASCAIVLAPWVRLPRRVGFTATGSVWTLRPSAALALIAATQLPACTAEAIWSAWPLSSID